MRLRDDGPQASFFVTRDVDDGAPADGRFEELVRQYAALIRRAVSRVAGTRGRMLSADIEQEVLLALWKQVRRGRPIDHPASYLYRAAVRETVRMTRALYREAFVSLDDVAAPESSAPSPLDDLHAAADATRLEKALAALHDDRRRAVEAHLAGLSAEEIMMVTGWSYNRTRNLIGRAMADVRRQLRRSDENG